MSYGFEIRNSSNEVVLDSSDTTFRIIHVQECEWDYTGTFTVSNFDSDSGAYYVKPVFTMIRDHAYNNDEIHSRSSSTNYNFATSSWWDDYSTTNSYSGAVQVKPSLSWNNTTKVMSVTAPTTAPATRVHAGTSSQYYAIGGHYDLVFFEVK